MQKNYSRINVNNDMSFGWVHHVKSGWKIKAGKYSGTYTSCCGPIEALNADDIITPNTNTYKLEGFKTGDYLIEAYDT